MFKKTGKNSEKIKKISPQKHISRYYENAIYKIYNNNYRLFIQQKKLKL